MPVTIKLPEPLRRLAGVASVRVDAKNVAAAIAALDRAHPGLADMLCTELGQPRHHVLIYVNEEEIRCLQGVATPLHGGEVIHIIPSVSGG